MTNHTVTTTTAAFGSRFSKRSVKTACAALAATAALLVAGCSSAGGEATETVYSLAQAGVTVTITLDAQGDELLTETTESVLDYEPNGFEDKDAAQEALESLVGEFETIDGMEHSLDFGDTSVTELVIIDYTVVDAAELAELNGLPADSSAKHVGLKERGTQLEAGGFTKQ